MDVAAALVPLMAILIAFDAFCLVDLVRHQPRALPRWAWALVILLVSAPLGGIVYLAVGRGAPRRQPQVDSAMMTTATSTSTSTALAPRPLAVPRGEPMVRTLGLTKRYPDHVALEGVNLTVPAGSVFGIVGPNGAGKTTLLSLLAGLRRPTAGSCELGVEQSRVGVMPDTPWFDPWLTAREVVDLARGLVDPTIDPARSGEALATVGLHHDAGRRVGGFSRGMLQRLGLAATIVSDPEVILLDEPCAALDPLGRREVLDLVAGLGDRATVLFCSHILDDVQEVCDAVGVLRDGRLLYQGTMADLLVGEAAPGFLIRLRPPLEPTEAALARAPWVQQVVREGREALRVTASSLAEAEAGLAGVLAGSGAQVVSVVPAAGDLEQVFLRLVAAAPDPPAGDRPGPVDAAARTEP